jgi:hypothetical protein
VRFVTSDINSRHLLLPSIELQKCTLQTAKGNVCPHLANSLHPISRPCFVSQADRNVFCFGDKSPFHDIGPIIRNAETICGFSLFKGMVDKILMIGTVIA